MFTRRVLFSFALFPILAATVLAQAAPPQLQAGETQRAYIVPRPAIPADPLELATGETKVLDTPQERATVLGLLERARQNSDLWGPTKPYVMHVSFSSSGAALYTGAGQMTQIWESPARFRFDAQLGSFTQTRLFTGGRAYDLRSNSFVPLRLQMVRSVLFWPMNFNALGMLRIAAGRLAETDLLCGLFSAATNDPAEMSSVPGRRWAETEFCVDPKSGLLRVYSEAPGIYAVYDYSEALEHNGYVLPRSINVTEAGQDVLDVRIESIADPTASDLAELVPSGELASAPIGNALSFPIRFPQFTQAPEGYKGVVHPVIVHAILGPDGHSLDQEALQGSDAVLTQAAMDLIRSRTFPAANPRLARAQREVFINVKFIVPVATTAAAGAPTPKP